ncbi:MAG TPA: SRPBCC domain-containing protein [Solirubrobacteraceae bacterium]|nr:SRPBCC domain-containing protein [Solirubrobacteraceae bacterium]
MVVNNNSNHLVVKEMVPVARAEVAQTEIEIDASPEEVWEALVTEEGRERWLQEPDRDIHVEVVESPSRLVWWWVGEEQPATRVEFIVEATPGGTRVVVTESEPSFPLPALAASFALVAA